MEKNKRDEKTRELANILEQLPDEALDAVRWAIKHIGFIEEMCADDDMTKEQFEKYMGQAREKKDYFGQMLLGFEKVYSKILR